MKTAVRPSEVDSKGTDKKQWASPRLIVHGSVVDITKGEIGSNLPDEYSVSL